MAREGMHRRDFVKTALAGGAAAGAASGVSHVAQAQESEAAPQPYETVPRRKLGTTGETIPIIFMGGSQTFDPKYDRMLHRAYKRGVDYIDSGLIYAGGQAHRTTAPFLQQVGRENIWVTSKVSLAASRATAQKYLAGLDDCLAGLETDYLDAFFMHMIKDERVLEPEFIKMGEDAKKSGKAKYFGFSCHDGNVPELMEKAARVGGIDMIMFRYNFRQYGDMKLNKAIDNCVKAGIGLMAMKTQSSVPDDAEKVADFQSKNFTLPQAKLKAVWADERISGCVSGMDNISIMEENTDAAMSPVELSMKEFNQLKVLAAMTAHLHCNGCSHICETKVGGQVRIADALRYLMYDEAYKDPETARFLYNNLKPIERDVEGVDFAEAEQACPNGIAIESRLRLARERLMRA